MAQNAHIGVFNGPEHAGSHFLAVLIETGMHAGDDDLHLRQHLIVQIQSAVGQNIHLDAGEDADAALHLAVHRADALDVFERPLLIQAVGHGQVFRVVGDGDVLVAASQRGLSHLADGVVSVGGIGVHVQVAAQVGLLNEPGQRVAGGSLNLAQVLAHLGRHPVHAQGGVDLFLGGGGNG